MMQRAENGIFRDAMFVMRCSLGRMCLWPPVGPCLDWAPGFQGPARNVAVSDYNRGFMGNHRLAALLALLSSLERRTLVLSKRLVVLRGR